MLNEPELKLGKPSFISWIPEQSVPETNFVEIPKVKPMESEAPRRSQSPLQTKVAEVEVRKSPQDKPQDKPQERTQERPQNREKDIFAPRNVVATMRRSSVVSTTPNLVLQVKVPSQLQN
eukprot:TRINITY_DN14041_c0_g2_i3.p2 TRINITY_DN14041_c0_g2~~TRINITY_DN14041_c0_g2_i3.p2  ORF type:complete len:120 (+),score=19.40 TRINITY_DN14041_c0_g2_i3:687-1046(+)